MLRIERQREEWGVIEREQIRAFLERKRQLRLLLPEAKASNTTVAFPAALISGGAFNKAFDEQGPSCIQDSDCKMARIAERVHLGE